ncbi:sigma-54-dependent Fis family transcriptional regulator [Alteromonas sediminis]|uniref:Sigma-54-dependent Fis family transcriptional regulator n=1 Tax=Alteromonas sediminis TaxID=2259342 RepID=A0A3N5XXV4_9ALTE|nr:sigma-54 dependent transcriptional regulator [Alteromonas sediminis]RPJ65907.1 sigma-54-dependent Fis family transcriptional regulator [Alteromonas sediminis]
MDKVLLVDDNPAVLEALSLLLEIHGFDVVTATDPKAALQSVNYQRISLVIQDMNFSADTTSGEEGQTLFYALRDINPHLPIILITAWTELEQAITLVKAGAADYIAKPWDDNKLINSVTNLIALGKAQQQNANLLKKQEEYKSVADAAGKIGLVYASTAMQRLVDMAAQVAKSDVSVLITGPNGSGKEKIAELIQSQSALNHAPFVKVNAGALPQDLIEAELFGAEAGAYTGANKARMGRFEAANGGTLFLDEIGNLPLSGQIKLLRVLQTGEFERLGSVKTQKTQVRVLSATNANLQQDIQAGRFREDLYYRINVIELNIPPLAARTDDILPLIEYFLPNRSLSLSAERALTNHLWPGNVRELENSCKRVAVLKPEGELEAEDFGLTAKTDAVSLPSHTQEPSKAQLLEALNAHQGVIARVAKQFGLSRQALYRRLNKYGIEY